jgi:hypothetical protein
MGLEGEIVVRLACDATGVRRATIASTRPDAVSRVLAGRAPGEAVALVPRLFAVCAQGQGAAASEAVAAACGRPRIDTRRARELAVALEAVQEDLWRLLVDWPPLIGIAPDIDALAHARRSAAPLLDALSTHASAEHDRDAPARDTETAVAEALHAIAATRVFGEPAGTFLARHDEQALRAWAQDRATPAALLARALSAMRPGLGASDVDALELDRAALERSVLPALDRDAAFARHPEIDGEPRETGALERIGAHPGLAALARGDGSGACTRLFARLVQLAASLVALRDEVRPAAIDAWSPRPGEGVAMLRTARGTLVHRARVAHDAIASYAIVAPTEWTFHPRGALARGLAGLRGGSAASLMRDASMIVRLADACVPCTVELADA